MSSLKNISIDDFILGAVSAMKEDESRSSVLKRAFLKFESTHGKSKKVSFIINALTRYEGDNFLKEIPDKDLEDNSKLLNILDNYRQERFKLKKKELSLNFLIQALYFGRGIPGTTYKRIAFEAGALEFYRKNRFLERIPEETLNNGPELLRYLNEMRSEIPEGKNSLGYFIQALQMGGRISAEESKKLRFFVAAAEYALENREMIGLEIENSYQRLNYAQRESKGMMKFLRANIDKEKFTQRGGSAKQLSRRYFRDVINAAMELYGRGIITRLETEKSDKG